MNRRRIVLLAALAAVGGCNSQPETIDASSGVPRQLDSRPELVASAYSPVADVPVPMGFALDEGVSRNYNLAGTRLVDHVYRGGNDRFAVWRFYERQMPIRRWTLSTAMFITGEVVMDFEKDNERCRVTIEKGSLFHPTKIKVKLWTSGRIDTVAAKGQTKN